MNKKPIDIETLGLTEEDVEEFGKAFLKNVDEELGIDDSLPLPVEHCPYCGSDGSSGTHYDYIIGKWVTDFYCDDCCGHTTIIHHVYLTLEPTKNLEDE